LGARIALFAGRTLADFSALLSGRGRWEAHRSSTSTPCRSQTRRTCLLRGDRSVFDPSRRSGDAPLAHTAVTPTLILFGACDHVLYPDSDRMAALTFDRHVGPFAMRDSGRFVPSESPAPAHVWHGCVLQRPTRRSPLRGASQQRWKWRQAGGFRTPHLQSRVCQFALSPQPNRPRSAAARPPVRKAAPLITVEDDA
jgi:hypothetical protein